MTINEVAYYCWNQRNQKAISDSLIAQPFSKYSCIVSEDIASYHARTEMTIDTHFND